MTKTNLLGQGSKQLEQLMVSLGEKPYRGRQLFKWLYKLRQYDFKLMTDLSKESRLRLDEEYEFVGLNCVDDVQSADGTRKLLFQLDDGNPLETVLMPDESNRRTICISSQAGCALGCKFCATGTLGLMRDLTVGEILGQLLYIHDNDGNRSVTNIVFMGMGEPLLNLDNVIEAIKIISAPSGLAIGAKKVSISTCGIVPGIKKLADSGIKSRLAISLHAATQKKRARIMPVAKKFNLEKLFEAIRYYTDKTKDRVTFEYILFKDFNDSMEDVLALSKLIRGIPCKINLLAYNPVDGLDFERPSDEKVDWFGEQLYPRAPAVMVRKSRGADIDAACGQLAAKKGLRSRSDA